MFLVCLQAFYRRSPWAAWLEETRCADGPGYLPGNKAVSSRKKPVAMALQRYHRQPCFAIKALPVSNMAAKALLVTGRLYLIPIFGINPSKMPSFLLRFYFLSFLFSSGVQMIAICSTDVGQMIAICSTSAVQMMDTCCTDASHMIDKFFCVEFVA